jgi:hypothetical protein
MRSRLVLVLFASVVALYGARTARVHREEEAGQQRLREQADLRTRCGERGALSPRVTHVSLVAPDLLALTIESGRVSPGSLHKYNEQAGDERVVDKNSDGSVRQVILRKDSPRRV